MKDVTEVEVGSLVPAVVGTKSELTIHQGGADQARMRDNALKVAMARINNGLDAKKAGLKAQIADLTPKIIAAAKVVDDKVDVYTKHPEKNAPTKFLKARETMQKLVADLVPVMDLRGKNEYLKSWLKPEFHMATSSWSVSIPLGQYEKVQATAKVALPEPIKSAQKVHADLQAAQQKLQKEMAATDVQLMQLPKTQRALEASIAEKDLRDTDDGAAVLDAMVSGLDKFISDPTLKTFLEG